MLFKYDNTITRFVRLEVCDRKIGFMNSTAACRDVSGIHVSSKTFAAHMFKPHT
jgi:hypothetical protein